MRQTRTREREKEKRNIPTCVRKTSPSYPQRECRLEHPHIRGEDQMSPVISSVAKGTSPHTWGRHTSNLPVFLHQGDIPTYVGKTEANEIRDRRSGNIPTYVGKTLKMLSKIRHLTFRKVPNLVTFKSHPEPSEKFRIPFLSFIRLSKRFVPPNFCRLERPLYNT